MVSDLDLVVLEVAGVDLESVPLAVVDVTLDQEVEGDSSVVGVEVELCLGALLNKIKIVYLYNYHFHYYMI